MSDDPRDRESSLQKKQEEFIKTFFKRGAEFADEILSENERLRFRVAELETRERSQTAAAGGSSEALRELLSRIEALEKEREELRTRYLSVQKENADWKARYHEVERENSSLASLYVASYQLHSTLDLKELVQIILEILLNFVGAKSFAVYLIDDADQRLHAVAAHGVEAEAVPSEQLGHGAIGGVAQSGRAQILAEPGLKPRPDQGPLVVTPLRIKDATVGVIVIWSFLVQKKSLVEVDHELFNLLEAHAAGAIQAAKRNAEAGGAPLRFAELQKWL
jgi:nitrate/nitrite-specific signal transduction histidine kinase